MHDVVKQKKEGGLGSENREEETELKTLFVHKNRGGREQRRANGLDALTCAFKEARSSPQS